MSMSNYLIISDAFPAISRCISIALDIIISRGLENQDFHLQVLGDSYLLQFSTFTQQDQY